MSALLRMRMEQAASQPLDPHPEEARSAQTSTLIPHPEEPERSEGVSKDEGPERTYSILRDAAFGRSSG
jgi:hypothetical protein